jgi:hypothetical protein
VPTPPSNCLLSINIGFMGMRPSGSARARGVPAYSNMIPQRADVIQVTARLTNASSGGETFRRQRYPNLA